MKLKEHLGFKRLAIMISLVSFIIAYISLIFFQRHVSDDEAFVVFPIMAIVISIAVFVFIRIIYWVIDGFRKQSLNIPEDI